MDSTNYGIAIEFSSRITIMLLGQVFTGTATGALTYSFIQTLEREPRLTYGHFLSTIRNKINKAQNGLLSGILHTHSLQVMIFFHEAFSALYKSIVICECFCNA